jgi:hydroxyquinol 1,2-dioxygenase
MLADAISHRKGAGSSERTVFGPFYVLDAPNFRSAPASALSTRRGHGVGRSVANVSLDIWQTNDDGFYDVQRKEQQPDFNLRGVFCMDEAGRDWFRAVKRQGARVHQPILGGEIRFR